MRKSAIIADPAKAIVKHKKTSARAKKLYQEADELLDQIVEVVPVGAMITMPDGPAVTIKDHFADKNKRFKNVVCNRYEIVEAKDGPKAARPALSPLPALRDIILTEQQAEKLQRLLESCGPAEPMLNMATDDMK